MKIPPHLKADVEKVCKLFLPHTKRLYFVGGAVRDSFLNIPIKDIDIEIYDIEPQLFHDLMASIDAKGVGKSFFVYKVGGVDVSLPRSEQLVGSHHNSFEVSWCNDELTASSRRDFTINSMLISVIDGKLTDHHSGMADLKNRLIRHIDDKTFVEDSLRVLRAWQFSARFGFRIADQTVVLCQNLSLENLSKDRIFEEYKKLITGTHTTKAIYYGYKLGIFEKLLGIKKPSLALYRYAKRAGLSDLLFLIRAVYKIPADQLISSFGADKNTKRTLARWKRPPHLISDRFLRALSLKGGLANYPAIKALKLEKRAKNLNIYDKPFDHGITAEKLFAEGHKESKEFGRVLKQRIIASLRLLEQGL